jgi:hypothetical protein
MILGGYWCELSKCRQGVTGEVPNQQLFTLPRKAHIPEQKAVLGVCKFGQPLLSVILNHSFFFFCDSLVLLVQIGGKATITEPPNNNHFSDQQKLKLPPQDILSASTIDNTTSVPTTQVANTTTAMPFGYSASLPGPPGPIGYPPYSNPYPPGPPSPFYNYMPFLQPYPMMPYQNFPFQAPYTVLLLCLS